MKSCQRVASCQPLSISGGQPSRVSFEALLLLPVQGPGCIREGVESSPRIGIMASCWRGNIEEGKSLSSKYVVICGSGLLPRLIVEELESRNVAVELLVLPGVRLEWLLDRSATEIGLGNFVRVLTERWNRGARHLVLAGAVKRPKYQTSNERQILGDAPVDLAAGDDEVLGALLAQIAAIGFDIQGAHQVLPELLVEASQLTSFVPSRDDRQDVERASQIVHQLGLVDVGQAAVVVQGLCVAVETATGTDDMLGRSIDSLPLVRPKQDGARGVLYKAPKPNQDLRVDLPTIGPETVRLAASAGLAGIAFEAGGVLLLERQTSVNLADRAGMFMWSRPAAS